MHTLIILNKYQFSAYLIPITNISESFISLTDTATDPIIGTLYTCNGQNRSLETRRTPGLIISTS